MMMSEAAAKVDTGEKRPGPEGRQHTRLTLELDVDFSSEHNFYNGFTENISSGGLFIATWQDKKLGEVIEMKFRLPDSQRYIEAEGEVRWVRPVNESNPDCPPGLGVRFTKISPEDVTRIDEFIREREPMFFDDE